MLENTLNQPSKFKTKRWVEINGGSRGTYDTNSQIKFKTSILKSRLRNYIQAYYTAVATAAANNGHKKVILKNCAPFADCKSKINNTQVDNAKDIAVAMSMYNLLEYSDNYSKISRNTIYGNTAEINQL